MKLKKSLKITLAVLAAVIVLLVVLAALVILRLFFSFISWRLLWRR